MAVKSAAGSGETFWDEYDHAYVERRRRARRPTVDAAAIVLGRTRNAYLWRWPIPESVAALRALARRAACRSAWSSNASGQIEEVLARSGVCQVGEGPGVPVRVIVDSHVVGVAKPTRASSSAALRVLRRHRPLDASPTSATR